MFNTPIYFLFVILFRAHPICMDKITLLFYGINPTILQQYDQYRRPWGSLVGLFQKLQAS